MALSVETWGDMIKLALKDALVVGVGQTPLAEDMTDACQRLNDMIAQWQRKRYLVYYLEEMSLPATGAQSYSIGPGGDFNVTERPSVINAAFARQVISSNPNQIDYPISILPSREDYSRIAMKSLESFPQWGWYEASYPLGNLFVYPVVSTQFAIHIIFPALLQKAVGLTDPINVPPEYKEALRYNLAARLAIGYGMPVPGGVQALAKSSLATLRTANAQIPTMRMPRGLVSPPKYNIFSDSAYS